MISIDCPSRQARAFKIYSFTFTAKEICLANDILGYDCTTYQGCYNFIVYLTKMRPQWFKEMGWKKPEKKKPIFHWDRGRRTSFSINDGYVNEEILREYVYPST